MKLEVNVMDDIINVLINNGASIGLLVYFIYKDNKYTGKMIELLTTLQCRLDDVLNKLGDDEHGN